MRNCAAAAPVHGPPPWVGSVTSVSTSSALAPGHAINATIVAFPDQDFTGEVVTIDSRVDPVTRAVTVRASLPNPDRLLRPGMLLTVEVFQPERQALVVPEIAVIQVSRSAHVYRVKPDDTVEQVDVELGQRRRGEVEILDGLSAGDRIVVVYGSGHAYWLRHFIETTPGFELVEPTAWLSAD